MEQENKHFRGESLENKNMDELKKLETFLHDSLLKIGEAKVTHLIWQKEKNHLLLWLDFVGF